MKLPADIEAEILSSASMPGLDYATRSRYARRIRVVREQMMRLSAEFAPGTSCTARYADAYFLSNFPANLMKTMRVINEALLHCASFPGGRSRVRVLDIGCGEGAGMLGLYYALQSAGHALEFRMTGIDSSLKMLERGRQMVYLIAGRDARLKARFINFNAGETGNPVYDRKHDMILCVNSLAEIFAEEILPGNFMGRLYGSLADDGLLVIIEPALKIYSRRLMALRDGLLRHRALQVILPCLHDGPCALLRMQDKREWCHQSAAWSPPAFLRILNEGLGREIDVLKFSYLVIAKTRIAQPKPNGYRVISQLLKEKGKKKCFLCTAQGRVELVRLNRSRTSANMRFDRIEKGSVISIENVVVRKPDYWGVDAQTVIEFVE